MKLLRIIKQSVPNTITCLNMISGCLATVFAFHYNETFGTLLGYQWAFLLIGMATLFDFCDGLSARLLHAYSAIGKDLDSLADLISFGFAPAALIYNAMVLNEADWIACVAFVVVAFGGLRLAKFNVDDSQTTSFRGLPIPSNAIFWIGTIAWIEAHFYPAHWVMIALILVTSYLMVCDLRMFSLKVKSLAWKGNERRYILILLTIIGIVLFQVEALAYAIILYLLLSLTTPKSEQ